MDRKKVFVDLQQLDLLEKKIVKATELIRFLRRERDEAQAALEATRAEVAAARSELSGSAQDRQALTEASGQLAVLQEERQEIRGKVAHMLELMAALDEAPAEARRDH
jgi:uncharacterized protein (DUF3084 family)